MKHVKIDSSKNGVTIDVDGEDVTDRINGLRLTTGAGQAPVVLFELAPRGVEFEGDAIVEIVNPERDRQVLIEFLTGVDARWLEEAMLSNDMSTGPADAALKALIDKARTEHGA
jgi:hypothetical protein